MEDLLMRIFEVGKHTFNPSFEGNSPPLIWAMPSAGSLYKDLEEGPFNLWLMVLPSPESPLLYRA